MKLRIKNILILCVLNYAVSFSQNLAQNGDFEFGECPETMSYDLDICDNWTSLAGDYFSKCSRGNVNTFRNFIGSQNPHSGNAYVGIFTGKNVNTHVSEEIFTKLILPLEKGESYKISFRFSLADSSGMFSKSIGCAFSNDSAYKLVQSSHFGTGLLPLLKLSYNLFESDANKMSNDTSWSLFEKEFVANGGEQFLYISGVQVGGISCIKRTIQPVCPIYRDFAYYYIDDVVLVKKNEDGSYPVIVPNTDTVKVSAIEDEVVKNEDSITKIDFREKFFFDVNSFELKDSTIPKLDSLVLLLQENKEMKILVKGFADKSGKENYNLILSQKRANMIKDFLIINRVNKNQVQVIAMGSKEASTLVSKYDRRVEITTLKQ